MSWALREGWKGWSHSSTCSAQGSASQAGRSWCLQVPAALTTNVQPTDMDWMQFVCVGAGSLQWVTAGCLLMLVLLMPVLACMIVCRQGRPMTASLGTATQKAGIAGGCWMCRRKTLFCASSGAEHCSL